MSPYSKKISLFLLVVFILTTIFFADFAQASFWDIIRAWVTINPLAVDVSVPSGVEVDKIFKVEAKLINKGEEKIEKAKGEIFLSPGLILLKKDPVQEIGTIPSKKEKKISWSVRGEKIESYIILVKASGELRGEIISAEDSTTVEVKETLKRTRSPKWFQNFLDFFPGWFRF